MKEMSSVTLRRDLIRIASSGNENISWLYLKMSAGRKTIKQESELTEENEKNLTAT